MLNMSDGEVLAQVRYHQHYDATVPDELVKELADRFAYQIGEIEDDEPE